MRIQIDELQELTLSKLIELGFNQEEANIVADHLIDAEISGKKGHGIERIKHFKDKIGSEQFDPKSPEPEIEKETNVSWRINGYSRSGIYVIEKFLNSAIEKAKEQGIYSVASTFGVNSGSIGLFARKAAEKGLIYIGFHNSSGGLIPYGAKKDIWGTNPITFGIPSLDLPVILDFASTKITYGQVLKASRKGELLPEDSVLDSEGNPSREPKDAWEGGILAMGEHKGSGLGMIVELLAGVLSFSRVSWSTKGGWGSFYILLDPNLFRPIEEFKEVVYESILELKSLPKQEGFDEIYFPGEQSQKLRKKALESNEIEISDQAYDMLTN